MRLMTESGPRGRTAGRYFGSSAEGDVPGRTPTDLGGGGEAEPFGRAGAGVAEGFTSTSAAKRAGAATKATAMGNQDLNMGSYATQCGCFRNLKSRQTRAKT